MGFFLENIEHYTNCISFFHMFNDELAEFQQSEAAFLFIDSMLTTVTSIFVVSSFTFPHYPVTTPTLQCFLSSLYYWPSHISTSISYQFSVLSSVSCKSALNMDFHLFLIWYSTLNFLLVFTYCKSTFRHGMTQICSSPSFAGL